MEAVERKNPDLKIGYVPVPAEIPVPAEALAREEMPAWCSADPSVGFRDSRLSVAGRICRSHGDTGACRCLDTGFQCAADGQFLRQDAEGAEMDESPCGSRIYSHRHLLLLDNVCINKINN